ncbi:MAG: minor extracellular serine protease Vpr [Verrucomicrobiota bacterium]
MKTFLILFSIALTTLVQAQSDSNATKTRQSVDTSSVIVQLNGDPLSTYVKTKPAQGKKIDFNNNTVKSYRAQLSALRNDFKNWLQVNAPKAKVTGQYDISLNAVSVQLNGESKATIEKAPQAVHVEYEGVYYPNTDDPDLGLIHAIQAWQLGGGPSNAGAEVKVAIVDTGIDIQHPCFSDAGYPAKNQLGDTRFTNNKVIAAKVFNNKAGVHGLTAQAIQEHGSHVAGTVGCDYNTPAVVDGVSIPYGISGVAPRALLGNYNIFPGQVVDARSEDILNALESAYADGFDVANMSLGGGAAGNQDLLTVAVDDLDKANMVVAVAAGNSGPGHYTIQSPGSAARALTAGASSVGHFIGAPVAVGGTKYGAAVGEFATVTSDLTAPLGVVFDGSNLGLACSALPAGSLTGKIALISRGSCSFSAKIRNAQDAGAVAVLIVNNVPGTPAAMAQDGTPNQPTIPAYMVSLADKAALVTDDGLSTTIGTVLEYFFNAVNNDFMASFSSQGPTDVDFRVKPDVVAPGVNVLSSLPISFCGGTPCFAFFNGTSMATPHLAGSAAVVRGQHPAWSAAQIRSAIVNTADQGLLKKFSAPVALETDVNIIGAGRENLLSAVNARVAIDPVSISFGAVPSGSGQTQTYSATLNNLSGTASTFSLAVGAGGGGVSYAINPSSVSLGAGGSTTVTVTMSAGKRAVAGDHQALLTISSGGSQVAHAVVYTLIK